MRRTALALIGAAVLLAGPVFGQLEQDKVALPAPPQAAIPVKNKPIVQIAILLDTSNSMDGLIEQAKAQLWRIVNEFSKASRDGVHPDIQVALYQYGTPSLGAETGYIRQLVPLTDDLDRVSAELFKLTTNGGDEYCGYVIRTATQQLAWSTNRDAYKAIFIAGNEPFSQGGVDYHQSCHEAIGKGIMVNTIFCGNAQEGINTGWKDGAALADGAYMSINQDAAVVSVVAPQDKELAELGAKINDTYVRFGAAGTAGAANQLAQDANAFAAGGRASPAAASSIAAERAVTKGSLNYRNGTWDLVDAVNGKQVDLKTVKSEDLPEEMRQLDEKGREAYLAQKTKERTEIQSKIQQLSQDRDKYVAEARKAQGTDQTLDAAVINAVHSQAKNNGMTFPDAK